MGSGNSGEWKWILWTNDYSVRTYSEHTSFVIAVCVLNAEQFVSGPRDRTLKL